MQLVNKIALEIPQEMIDKIKFLCKSIPKLEWSGVLFYEVEGSIRDTSNMKIILRDILLMDRGSAAYTSFDWDEDVVTFQMDNPHVMDWKIGHIHSHNTMNVFFSGTDWSELNDNCTAHNFYLSVIVNNYLDVAAKIAFTAESQKFVCKDENGKDYTLTLSNANINPKMFVYDCDVSMPPNNLQVSDDFVSRYKAVEEKVAAAEAERAKLKKQAEEKAKKMGGGKVVYEGGYPKKSPFPDYNPRHKKKTMDELMYEELEREMAEDLSPDDFTMQTIEQEFATYVLRLGNDELEEDELVDALEDIEASNLNAQSLTASILQSYGAYYERFFEKIRKYHGDEAFVDVLEEVIDIFEAYSKDYAFLDPLITGLKEMGIKFENFRKAQTV